MYIKPVKEESGINWHWCWYDTKQKAKQVVNNSRLAYREDDRDEDGLYCVAIAKDK